MTTLLLFNVYTQVPAILYRNLINKLNQKRQNINQ